MSGQNPISGSCDGMRSICEGAKTIGDSVSRSDRE